MKIHWLNNLLILTFVLIAIAAWAAPDKLIFGVLESYALSENAVATNDVGTVKRKFKAIAKSDRLRFNDATLAYYQGKPTPNIPIRFFDMDIERRRSVLPALNVNQTNLVNWIRVNVSNSNKFFWAWYDSDVTTGWAVLSNMLITAEEL